jgi:hypothetical protein
MRRIQKCFGLAAPIVFAVVGINGASASAASQPTVLDWQAAIGQVPAVGSGCFQASFPALVWHAVKCAKAPEQPFAPALPTTTKGAPDTVGNGHDYSATVSGLISKATGTFAGVSSNISEKGKIGNSGPQKANEFSLQLNTQFFSGSPACAKASIPSQCEAWQQFVYATDTNTVFMQYWLIDYNTTCPSGWFTSAGVEFIDCYTNSSSTTASGGALTAKSLATLSLSGSAKSGGNDAVQLVNGGHATMATGKDTKVDLAPHWTTTEWGVFGDGGGGAADFGASNTLEAVTKLTATSSSAPTCAIKGFTGETNNLKLAATSALGSEPSPTIGSKQTDGTSGTASCAVSA